MSNKVKDSSLAKNNGSINDREKNDAASNDVKNSVVPFVHYFWQVITNSLPSMKLYGLDVSITVVSFLFFSLMRFIYINTLERGFDWPSNNNLTTLSAAASLTSITHSILLVPDLLVCLLDQRPYKPSARMNEAPPYWQTTVTGLLQFCTGYMLYDSVWSIGVVKWRNWDSVDLQYLLHHIATTVYMTATRYYQAGHQSAMMCMFLGELTNPCHNGYYFADYALQVASSNGAKMRLFHQIIKLTFASSYVLMRAVVAPPIMAYTCYDLLKNGYSHGGISRGMLIMWVLLIVGVMVGSLPWVFDCWNMFTSFFAASLGSNAGTISEKLVDGLHAKEL